MIKALLCDLGNVLVFFSHDRMVRQIAALAGREPEAVRQVLFESGLVDQYEVGQIETADVRLRLERELNVKFSGQAELSRAASDIFWANEAMVHVIEKLVEREFPMVMVSNTSQVHREWVERQFPVFSLFEHHCLSYEVHSAKPDRQIFDRACELVGVGHSDCIFVDDTLEHVQAAKSYGFQTLHFEDVHDVERALAKVLSD